MRKILIGLAASLAIASPALANEGRVEARGGIVWDGGASEDAYGVALGYDWDLGEQTFAGLEVSGDKIAASGTGLGLGFTGRFGVKASEKTKVFADAGYTVNTCTACEDAFHAGAGVEFGIGEKAYAKLGYRHYFVGNGFSDYDAAVVGVGMRF